MRGADPTIFLLPGVGMFSFGSDSQTARVAGEFYVAAINAIRGAEALSTYAPISEAEKFRIEYWVLEERKLQRRPRPKPLTGKIALVTGAGSGIGRAIAMRLREEGATITVADIDVEAARTVSQALGSGDDAIAVQVDVRDEQAVKASIDEMVARFGGVDIVVNNAGLSISKALLETSVEDWDRQHDVMARGSFLVSKHAARVMIAQETGGDILYIVSKNAIVAGPSNLAYGSAKASQAHQVRLLAAELGEHGIRVNGINPDAVVQGSGIFAGGWGAERARIYGVAEHELGRFYASRTLLKREVLPEHVANAAFCLISGELTHTTGLIVPVDAGIAAAFPALSPPAGVLGKRRSDDRPGPNRRAQPAPARRARPGPRRTRRPDRPQRPRTRRRWSERSPSCRSRPRRGRSAPGDPVRPLPGRRGAAATVEKIDDVAALRRWPGPPGRSRSTCRGTTRPIPKGCASTRPGRGHRVRHHELQHLPGQPVDDRRRKGVRTSSRPGQRGPGHPPGGRRAQPLRHRSRGAAGFRALTVWLARQDQPPTARPTPGPVRAGAEGLRSIHEHLPEGLEDVHRAQALRARVLRDREPGLELIPAPTWPRRPDRRRPARGPRSPSAQRQHQAGGQPAGDGRAP